MRLGINALDGFTLILDQPEFRRNWLGGLGGLLVGWFVGCMVCWLGWWVGWLGEKDN